MTTSPYTMNHPKVTLLMDEVLSQLMSTGLEHGIGITCALMSKSNTLKLTGSPVMIRPISHHSFSISRPITCHKPTYSQLQGSGKGYLSGE